MPTTWYHSVEWQLFAVSPLIIYCIWRWKLSKYFILPALLLAVQLLSYLEVLRTQHFLKGLNLASYYYDDYAKLYHQTHFRAAPWIIGIAAGDLFYNSKELKIGKVKFICKGSYTY